MSSSSAARIARGVQVKKENVKSAFSKKTSLTGTVGFKQLGDSPKVRTGIRVIEPNSGVSEKATAGKIGQVGSVSSSLSRSGSTGNGSSTGGNGIREFRPLTADTNSDADSSGHSLPENEDKDDRRRGYLPIRRIGAGVLGGGLLAAGIAANENGAAATAPVGRSGNGLNRGRQNGAGAVGGGSGLRGRNGRETETGRNGTGGDNAGVDNGGGITGEASSGGSIPMVIASDGGGINDGISVASSSGSGNPATGAVTQATVGGVGGGVPVVVPPPIGKWRGGNEVPDTVVSEETLPTKKKKRSKVIYWTVQPNQTIQSLAASVSCSAEDIRALNKISFLVPGQTILLPVKRVESRTWTP